MFNLIDALSNRGYDTQYSEREDGSLLVTQSKVYRKEDRVNDKGILNEDFEVSVTTFLDRDHGIPVNVLASYSNGKRKYHDYGKRAFNAIRDTVKNNGFEL